MRKHRRKPYHLNRYNKHDQRSFYRSSELARAQIAAVEIPDPYGSPAGRPGVRRRSEHEIKSGHYQQHER